MDHLGRMLVFQSEYPSKLEDQLLHSAVTRHLIPGTISASRVYECPLASGRTGFHKPVDGMRDPHPRLGMPVWRWYDHADEWAIPVNECAAWRVARHLGTPWDTLVATSVVRWIAATGPGIVGGWGSLTRKGDGPSGHADPVNDSSLRDPAAFFDCLIGNQDRHAGNYRYERGVLTLFDHNLAFPGGQWRFNNSIFLEERNRVGAAGLTRGELDLLVSLSTSELWTEMRSVLRADQFDALEWRRAEMVQRREVLPSDATGLAP